ncbi:type I pullulanase [Aquibacillus saliphilus]|uniref:type I pullulanase n=1 Tax=Aquibacillus saliphilus TaxID=1909422 RepID=UPI001CF0A75D|nr:type I pullulanase [Aquibacillus saliphilus]
MENSIAWIDGEKSITVELSGLEIEGLIKTNTRIVVEGQEYPINKIEHLTSKTATINLETSLPLGQKMYLGWKDNELPIYPRGIVRTAWFDQSYDASDEQLGYIYSPEKTSFSVWAPTATTIDLVLEDYRIKMGRKANGVWHTIVAGNWNHSPYHFAAVINGKEQLVNDPYGKSMTANSSRSVVLNLESTDPSGFDVTDYPKISKQDAIIYELHIRDATSSNESGATNKGKFLGLTETNTKNSQGFSTGLSYIKQLGCTHVQLLPVGDFARVDERNPDKSYNWGYDPLFYFVPEGSYATSADNPYLRVNECKQMIQAFHQEGLSIILDVVYNHVFYHQDSALERLVPGYYFRYKEDGSLSNGSGTGNDIATERKMARKLILDCIDYWITEYKVDGFRFDLMGAIDLDTMKAIRIRCLQENRPIVLLGEGWELDTELQPEQKTTSSKSNQLLEVSFFNDTFRDSLKGNLFETMDVGYANGNGHYIERLPQLVSGSCLDRFGDKLFSNPLQSVNYVECHDNHTLSDRLMISSPDTTEQNRKRMHQLATGLTILSQGIPFLHAGQEFFRTKQGDENSYISGDEINQIDWQKRGIEDENVQWIKNLISLRKKYRLFGLSSAKEIQHRLHIISTPDPVFGYMLIGESEDFAIFINPTNQVMEIGMPAQGRWEKQVSNLSGSISPISCLLQTKTEIGGYELAVWKKNRV